MEQRLRLVQGAQARQQRASERKEMVVPGQIVWKDARGTTRMVPVVTRNVSDEGVLVDCLGGGAAIPLYRMVYFQVERADRERRDLPAALRKTNVLAAVFRVGPCSPVTGAPTEYALRLLVEPEQKALAMPPVRRSAPVVARAMTA
jgi:hypothetical protein